jgi:carboxypeptidase Taq
VATTTLEVERTLQHARDTALLEGTMALLEWDDRTGLPVQAGDYRAEQITQLSGLIHQRKVDPEFAETLTRLNDQRESLELGFAQNHSIRLLYRDLERNRRLPIPFVQALSKATVLGQQAWEKARHANDWAMFKPHLQEIVRLKREEAQLLSDGGNLYDALLDQYEMGARVGQSPGPNAIDQEQSSDNLTSVFAKLRDGLRDLIGKLSQAQRPPTGASWNRPVEIDRQRSISRWVAESIGYSFQRGRLDETSHPFCTTLGPNDCRILTRYQREFFPSGFYGTLHEAGHGLYEQGLPTQWYGLPAGKYAGLGVHESQSRLWENMVGRSLAFWQWASKQISPQAGGAWDGLTPEDLFRDANLVKPSLIRVEADEATYNLHILIRFELEQQLIDQQLSVDDAPCAWNDCYKHYLGIEPPNYRDGILQDVHWSAGLIGYFPTYTLGNLYAAQLMQAAQGDLGDLDELLRQGQFRPLLEWLQVHVHAFGACYAPADLIGKACGRPLDHQPLLNYLQAKLFKAYQL